MVGSEVSKEISLGVLSKPSMSPSEKLQAAAFDGSLLFGERLDLRSLGSGECGRREEEMSKESP